MTGALAGRRVLVPRGGEWGDKVARLVAAHGGDATVVPLIAFARPDDGAPLDAAVRRLADGGYAWLVVTSATTVDALAERAAALRGGVPGDGVVRGAALGGAARDGAARDGAALRDAVGATPVAAVGPGTARALDRLGVRTALVPAGERSGRGLVAEMPAAPPDPAAAVPGETASSNAPVSRRVLVPHSDLAEPTVVDGLRAKGWDVDDVVAYRTVPGTVTDDGVGADLRAGRFDAVLLSSASTVRNLLDLLGRPPASTTTAVIGPRTREAAVGAGLRVDVEPAQASAEELVTALAAHLGRPAAVVGAATAVPTTPAGTAATASIDAGAAPTTPTEEPR